MATHQKRINISNIKEPLVMLAAATFVLLNAAHAQAQTAGQIVEDNYAPPILRSSRSGITISGDTASTAPDGADRLFITPSGLTVSGGFPDLSEETKKIEEAIKNKRIPASALFTAAKDLEAAYAAKGYLFARITLPPQTVKDGASLKLVVTDGFLEAVDYSALPQHVQGRLASLLDGLKFKRHLTKTQLERKMLFVSDLPGLFVNSTLKAGNKPGGTILVLSGKYQPVAVNVGLDNGLSAQLGNYAANINTDINNYFGYGEVIYLRLGGYTGVRDTIFDDMPRNRQLVLGTTFPLGIDGWWLNLEGVDSRTNPKSEQAFSIEDHYQRFSAGIGYHWLRSRDRNISTTLSFEISDADQYLHFNGVSDWSKDKLRNIQLTQNFDAFLPWDARFNASLTATLGLDRFGARNATVLLPMTRAGASPEFTKLGYSFVYHQDLTISAERALKLTVTSRGQTSFGDALPASEQLGLGSMDWLSAFNSGAIQGDSALAIRAELAYPIMLDLPESWSTYNSQLSPYLFAAAGISKLAQPSAVEASVTRASSVGFGMRYGLSQPEKMRGYSLALEFAHGTVSDAPDDNRINFKIASTF